LISINVALSVSFPSETRVGLGLWLHTIRLVDLWHFCLDGCHSICSRCVTSQYFPPRCVAPLCIVLFFSPLVWPENTHWCLSGGMADITTNHVMHRLALPISKCKLYWRLLFSLPITFFWRTPAGRLHPSARSQCLASSFECIYEMLRVCWSLF
jgi:hypothetical protein